MRMLLASFGAALVVLVSSGTFCGAAASDAPPGAAVESTHHHDDATPDPDSGEELLGRPAPAWTFTRWIGPPLSLEHLRGKVVLVRWWTEGCHFCGTTLPVIERLRLQHADDGLVVVGVFHPKPPHAVSDRHILAVARRLGFHGAIAVDREWATLNRYWLDGHPDRNWTSVSFLIDREGLIRWVHGGGEYHPSNDPEHARCDLQYHDLEKALTAALAEQSQTSSMR